MDEMDNKNEGEFIPRSRVQQDFKNWTEISITSMQQDFKNQSKR